MSTNQLTIMKNTLFNTLAIGAASAAMIGSASAVVIAADDFSYPDGGLSGQNGGTGWDSLGWANRSVLGGNNVVDATDAVLSGVASASGDNVSAAGADPFGDQAVTFRSLGSTVAETGGTWVTVDMAFTAGAHGSAFVSIFLGLGDPPATGDPTSGSAWSVGEQWGSDKWSIGSASYSGVTASTDSAALDTLLFKIDHDLGVTGLWVNPADGALGAADAETNLAPGSFNSVMFRAGGQGGTTRTVAFDNLILATELVDVHTVPEPSSSALLGLAGLALILRRRK